MTLVTECIMALIARAPATPQLHCRAAASPRYNTSPSSTMQVRKYGSTQSFWYDETVLLPALQQDLDKQVALRGGAFLMPRGSQGVPVTDGKRGVKGLGRWGSEGDGAE